MRLLWLSLIVVIACGPSTTKKAAPATAKPAIAGPATAKPATAKSATANNDTTGFEPIPHGICVPMAAVRPGPDIRKAYSDAMAQFHKAGKMTVGNHWKEAAGAYLKAASMLRIEAPIAETNRRIAYANATISFINAKLPDQARAALSAAANQDPALAVDLRKSASELPKTPHCALRRSP